MGIVEILADCFKILKSDLNFSEVRVGDFIEVEGELQKNPIINYMDSFIDLFRMADIFTEKTQLGNRTQAKNQKQKEDEVVKQIKSFTDELKHSGTIDFILSDVKGTTVLSVQEQYLANDNISEILGANTRQSSASRQSYPSSILKILIYLEKLRYRFFKKIC